MSRSGPWLWTQERVQVDREVDGSRVQVWVCPNLPSASARSGRSLGVEVFCWFADVAALNAGLAAFWGEFARDSTLAGVHRRDSSWRVLFYTSATEPVAQRRYMTVRAALRPRAMGVRLADEPGWDTLREFASAVGAHHAPAWVASTTDERGAAG